MPGQRRRAPPRKQAPLGLYDLSTRLLPGGMEIQALAAGYAALALSDSQEAAYPARERAREQKVGYNLGYVEAASFANGRMIRDTAASYIVLDITKPHGGIMRGVGLGDVLKEYGADISFSLKKALPKTESTQRKMLDSAMGLSRGHSVADGLPAQYKFVVKDGLIITHAAPAKAFLRAQDRMGISTRIAGLLAP
jgi:hypothetical protein